MRRPRSATASRRRRDALPADVSDTEPVGESMTTVSHHDDGGAAEGAAAERPPSSTAAKRSGALAAQPHGDGAKGASSRGLYGAGSTVNVTDSSGARTVLRLGDHGEVGSIPRGHAP